MAVALTVVGTNLLIGVAFGKAASKRPPTERRSHDRTDT